MNTECAVVRHLWLSLWLNNLKYQSEIFIDNVWDTLESFILHLLHWHWVSDTAWINREGTTLECVIQPGLMFWESKSLFKVNMLQNDNLGQWENVSFASKWQLGAVRECELWVKIRILPVRLMLYEKVHGNRILPCLFCWKELKSILIRGIQKNLWKYMHGF